MRPLGVYMLEAAERSPAQLRQQKWQRHPAAVCLTYVHVFAAGVSRQVLCCMQAGSAECGAAGSQGS